METAIHRPRQPGKSAFAAFLASAPSNRKSRRTFASLRRRKKLRHMGAIGLFTPRFIQLCAENPKGNW